MIAPHRDESIGREVAKAAAIAFGTALATGLAKWAIEAVKKQMSKGKEP